MDVPLEQRFYQFLAGREGKKDKTLSTMMRTFRRMKADGFDFTAFERGEEAAQEEGDRYLLWLRTAPPRTRGRRPQPGQTGRGGGPHVKKVLAAMVRMRRMKDVDWRVPQKSPGQRDCYMASELGRLLRLPYGRSELRRLERALIEAHLALGWRLDELAPLEDFDIHPEIKSVFMRYPEKNNPQRMLPVEDEFFAGHDGKPGARNPFQSWLRERPVWKGNPHRVWVYTDNRDRIRPLTGPMLARILSQAGRKVGVRANCTRGRHTRCAAHLAQGKQLAWVKFYMSGPQGTINTLTAYIEMIGLGLLNHLKRTSWFVRPPPKED